jgi:hypothetical protein
MQIADIKTRISNRHVQSDRFRSAHWNLVVAAGQKSGGHLFFEEAVSA